MPVTQALSDAEAVVSAVDQEAYGTARERLESFTEAVNEATVDESNRKARVVATRDRTLTRFDGANALDPFLSAHSSIQFARAGFVITAQGMITDPGSAATDDLRSALSRLVDQEEAYRSATDDVEPVLSSVSLPGQPDVLSAEVENTVQPKGATFDLTAVVGNVGDEPVEDVQLAGSVDGPVSLDPTTYTVASLASRSRVERVFSASADGAGGATLSVGLQEENGLRRRKNISIEVKGKQEFIETVRSALTNLNEELESSEGRTQPFRAKINNAARKLEDAQAAMERGQTGRADNMLNAASRILGALLNQLAESAARTSGTNGEQKKNGNNNGKNSSQVKPSLVQTLRAEAETRIDQIQLAIVAEV